MALAFPRLSDASVTVINTADAAELLCYASSWRRLVELSDAEHRFKIASKRRCTKVALERFSWLQSLEGHRKGHRVHTELEDYDATSQAGRTRDLS